MNTSPPNLRPFASGDASNKGFLFVEARQFIEFCVELDNQDDRLKSPGTASLKAQLDSDLWNPAPIFDSRSAVAHDTFRFTHAQTAAGDEHWEKLYRKNSDIAVRKYGNSWTEKQVFDDPDANGFGPWQNAWTLYKGEGPFAGSYAIAIRGTVFSNEPSVAEDAYFHTVSAQSFLSKSVRFSDSEWSALHSGFAHATFSLILDDRYGILRALETFKIPPGARIYIVGHSQGAAMATLVHAFMHYAMAKDEADQTNTFGLRGKQWKLKSYGFAQPKPGNYDFSADFAAITQPFDNAIVINNNIDSVPDVPLTLQGTGDLESAFSKAASPAVRVLQFVSSFGQGFRRLVAALAEPFVKQDAAGYGYFYRYENLKPLGRDESASSWNFVPAGHVIYVFGHAVQSEDLFLQHHATTYRALIEEQLK